MNKKKANRIFDLLSKEYPAAHTALKYNNIFQLMVATILSAQCTDKRVNIVTKELFKKYKTPGDFASARREELEEAIRSTGFYRNKSKNIIAAGKMVINNFNGNVPDDIDELVKIPGVARKTANIVLYHGFGKNQGIAVDTHVTRLSQRLGLTLNKDPKKIERDLMPLYNVDKWGILTNLLISHGRAICRARNPFCDRCFLNKLCPYFISGKYKKI